MSNQSYQDAPPSDHHHFIDCSVCGEKIDCRDLDEVLGHETHKPRADIPYSGSAKKLGEQQPAGPAPAAPDHHFGAGQDGKTGLWHATLYSNHPTPSGCTRYLPHVSDNRGWPDATTAIRELAILTNFPIPPTP